MSCSASPARMSPSAWRAGLLSSPDHLWGRVLPQPRPPRLGVHLPCGLLGGSASARCADWSPPPACGSLARDECLAAGAMSAHKTTARSGGGDAKVGVSGASHARTPRLPVALTRFIGRERELVA